MGILDDYRAELSKDKENENNNFPEGSHLDETQRKEYEKRLSELRNNQNDIENAYRKKMLEMKQMSENDMSDKNLIKDQEVKKIIVKHAYCSECGEELISKTPPMFNPFTLERICKHTCQKCGTVFNLQYSYPRFALIDENNNEIIAFGH